MRLGAAALVAAACSGDVDRPPPAGLLQDDAEVVARIGGRDITRAEADAPIAGALHELEYERYRLRRATLESTLVRDLQASSVRTAEVLLHPPLPPAVDLAGTPAAARPEDSNAVTVTVFCDFQSPHCAQVQPLLADLRVLYPATVRVAARDLPLAIHPLALPAAEAARCAGLQGRYWAFHDLLWARGRAPDRVELERVAQAVGVDAQAFDRCVANRETASAVGADLALARRLGIGIVPAVFVEGRRATPPVTIDQLVWLVEAALGDEANAPEVARSPGTALPLELRATLVGPRPGLGLALVGAADGGARVVREGERVTSNALLRRVSGDGAELLVDGRPMRLSFDARAATPGSTAPSQADAESRATAPAVVPAGPGSLPVHLDRELVRERMADRVALSRELQPVTMTVDGYRLLQLGAVPPGSLYELLGLQAGDVIVAVNERPVHEGDNPLWDALDREAEVRVRVMRRGGLAQHYTYRFD